MDKRDKTMNWSSHCDHGHLWDEENTYLLPSGTKVCRACNRSTHWADAGFPDIEMYFRNKHSGLDPL